LDGPARKFGGGGGGIGPLPDFSADGGGGGGGGGTPGAEFVVVDLLRFGPRRDGGGGGGGGGGGAPPPPAVGAGSAVCLSCSAPIAEEISLGFGKLKRVAAGNGSTLLLILNNLNYFYIKFIFGFIHVFVIVCIRLDILVSKINFKN
jgi:hypothetical protein